MSKTTPANPATARRSGLYAVLYADGQSYRQIAAQFNISWQTVADSVKRVRQHYKMAGLDATDLLTLRACLVKDGLLIGASARGADRLGS